MGSTFMAVVRSTDETLILASTTAGDDDQLTHGLGWRITLGDRAEELELGVFIGSAYVALTTAFQTLQLTDRQRTARIASGWRVLR